VPLLGKLEPVSAEAVKRISAKLPGIPDSYLKFIHEIGVGEWKDELGYGVYEFFEEPIDAAKDYFRDRLIFDDDVDNPGAVGNVWLFGCDSTGIAFGFDSGDGWQLVEIDSTRSVTRLNLTFEEFVEGLLVCYPQRPVRFSGSKWYDSEGVSYIAK
jgi:hypothetical protein